MAIKRHNRAVITFQFAQYQLLVMSIGYSRIYSLCIKPALAACLQHHIHRIKNGGCIHPFTNIGAQIARPDSLRPIVAVSLIAEITLQDGDIRFCGIRGCGVIHGDFACAQSIHMLHDQATAFNYGTTFETIIGGDNCSTITHFPQARAAA